MSQHSDTHQPHAEHSHAETSHTEHRLGDLNARWADLIQSEGQLRTREAAKRLAVSELVLTTSRLSDNTVLLSEAGLPLLRALEAVGPMMALTRNESAVIEKVGRYRNFDFENGHVGNVLDEGIDLRVFLQHWKYAVALSLPKKNGVLRGIAFFNASGDATHKAYLRADSDEAAFDALVTRFRAEDQVAITGVEPVAERFYRDKSEVDVERFRAGWLGMQDTHDFFFLLYKHKLHRLDGLALSPEGHALALHVDSLGSVLTTAAQREVPLMVFVGSRGCIEIHTGPVRRVVSARGWLNVLDPEFNLHVDEQRMAQAWLVRKPTADGIVTSLEVYDPAGETICLLFGVRKPGTAEDPRWRSLLADSVVAR